MSKASKTKAKKVRKKLKLRSHNRGPGWAKRYPTHEAQVLAMDSSPAQLKEMAKKISDKARPQAMAAIRRLEAQAAAEYAKRLAAAKAAGAPESLVGQA